MKNKRHGWIATSVWMLTSLLTWMMTWMMTWASQPIYWQPNIKDCLACFQPICNMFLAHFQYTFSPFFNLLFQPITTHYYSIYNKHTAHIDNQLVFLIRKNLIQQHIRLLYITSHRWDTKLHQAPIMQSTIKHHVVQHKNDLPINKYDTWPPWFQ
jgi:hypothetical protein